ncbi:NAD-dependent epimerase/dehydratase family protein [Geomobilimonas luticola]|uniref:NAD(P)-dependent oxidoreductase n=1 Tax=Geomobilimonas luticola TaxID=1114878 RepID=A0ABS5SAA0_9BACT|nr:NAD(P)-dependent oxidoreductase [Geomobilimonas luticola]MBT0652294.1 NAD(P)-dependent oxidoreductase [Geomobilimonas luticola]
MKIFITGICGVVGSELARELRSRGHLVTGCDLEHTHLADYYRCDVADYRQLRLVLESVKPDYVYNAAAEFGRRNGEEYYEQLFRTNMIGTKNLITLAREFDYGIVQFSSSEVYGDYDGVMTEDVPERVVIRPLNDYAGTKIFNEWQMVNGHAMFGIRYVTVRLFNLYGNEPYSPYRSAICRFCYDALTGRRITVHQGHQRSFIYIADAVHTLANIVDTFQCGEVYNIGNSREMFRIEEVAELIVRKAGASPALLDIREAEPLTTRIKVCDTTAAERALGHRITVGFEEGIERTLAFLRAEHWL